jgi:multisubunit Na+/H+ antiporter MnhE subunit
MKKKSSKPVRGKRIKGQISILRRGLLLPMSLTLLTQWALWLIYTDSTGYREMIAGAIAAAIATLAVMVFTIQGNLSFQLQWKDVVQAIYLPWFALEGTWEILQGLAIQLFTRKGAQSFIGAVPFDVGQDQPRPAGRRALAVAYTTITPNFVVLGIVHAQGLLLYHQIVPGKVRAMTRHLGARP